MQLTPPPARPPRAAQTREAPVVVWHAGSKKQVYNLFGIRDGVKHLAFAPDDRFLVAAGTDDSLFMWDMQTGEQLHSQKCGKSIGFLAWGGVTIPHRRPEYTLFFSLGSSVHEAAVTYDVRVLRYKLTAEPAGMPCTGYNRAYLCGAYDRHPTSGSVLAGTESGEMAVFSAAANVYRGSFPIGSGGVHALCVVPPPPASTTSTLPAGTAVQSAADAAIAQAAPASGPAAVYAGTGEGALVRVVGGDLSWTVQARVDLAGCIVSISAAGDGSWLLVGTAAGRLYRVAVGSHPTTGDVTLSPLELEAAHTGPVTCVAFGTTSSEVFATGSADGRVRVWDLNDYSVLQSSRGPGGVAVTAVAMDDTLDGSIVSAWEDGALRAFTGGTGELLWHVPAHRGAATSLALTPLAVISGGEDCRVAVWSRDKRELVAVFADHTKGVLQVLPDVLSPAILHSVGADRCVFAYDLRTERQVVCHQLPSTAAAALTAISQRRDSEQEIITAGADGRLLCWDVDLPETPVQELPAPNAARVNALAVSPSGRFLATAGDDASVTVYELMPLSTELATQGVTPVGGQVISRKVLEGHTARVLGLAWAPDERQIVSVGEDCCIVVYNFYGGEEGEAQGADGSMEAGGPLTQEPAPAQPASKTPSSVPGLRLG